MGKKKEGTDSNEKEMQEQRLNVDLQKSIDDLIFQQKRIAIDQEALGEATSAVAERLGIKPALLKKRISIIIKEEDQGGEVKSKQNDIDFAEEYFTIKNNPT